MSDQDNLFNKPDSDDPNSDLRDQPIMAEPLRENEFDPSTNPYRSPDYGINKNKPGDEDETAVKRKGSVGLVVTAWVFIFLFCNLIFWPNFFELQNEPVSEGQTKAELQEVNMQVKMLVGMSNLTDTSSVASSLEKLNTGPLEHRYCYVLLRNEYEDANTALEDLEELDVLASELNYDLSDNQKRLKGVIGSLLTDYQNGDWSGGSLANSDRAFLTDQLGYTGRLALAPSAGGNQESRDVLIAQGKRSFVLMVVFFFGVVLAGIAGIFSSAIFLGVVFTSKITWHFKPDSGRGRIYAETFAIWMFLFLFLGLPISLVLRTLPEPSAVALSLAGLLVFFGSLVGVLWPCFRGVTLAELADDIGWKLKNPVKEAALGVFAYFANLPIMFLGFASFFILTLLTGTGTADTGLEAKKEVTHPIVGEIASGNIMLIVLVVLTACVAAPIVEETVFRGVLYRHLRESSLWTRRLVSATIATLVNSFIFAAIHPQGWMAIPLLMALAIGFSWAREWRESLIAPMTMHALNNATITTLMISMFV